MGWSKASTKGGKGSQGWSANPWQAQGDDGWGGDDAWGAGPGKGWQAEMSAGGGKSWGKTGKGKGKGKSTGKDKGWPEEEEAKDPSLFTSRIKSNYQISKQLLRASMDETGGALVKSDWAKDDAEILSFENFSSVLSTGNSHLLRRPGVGLSELAGSMRHGMEVLEAVLDTEKDPVGLFAWKEVMQQPLLEALKVVDQKGPEGVRTQENLQAALRVLLTWFQENQDIYDKVKDTAIAAARLYLFSMATLQGLVCAGDTAAWAEMIPETNSESKEFRDWQNDPSNDRKTRTALATLLRESVEEAKKWGKGKGNGAASTFGQVSVRGGKKGGGKERRKKDKDDVSEAAEEKDKKKDKKADKKKKKKDKKKSSSSSDSPSLNPSAQRKADMKLARKAAAVDEGAKQRKRRGKAESSAAEEEDPKKGDEEDATLEGNLYAPDKEEEAPEKKE
jgi:hypothetical protein